MKKFDQYEKYILVGGGTMAERLFPQTETSKRKLVGVVDFVENEKRKVKRFDKFVIKNAYEASDELQKTDCAIVIAINGFYAKDIIEQELIKIVSDFDRIFIANPYTSLRPCVINDDFASETRIPTDDKRYERVKCLFDGDEESEVIFELLRKSKTYDNVKDTFELVTYQSIRNHYVFSEDYFKTYNFKLNKHGDKATVFDCGAYIGDSIAQICSSIPEKNIYYYAFEPVSENAEIIRKDENLSKFCTELRVLECGVGEKDEILKFDCVGQNGNYDNGRFCDNANSQYVTELQVKSIDGLNLQYQGRLYIKMDIEGAELSALMGAKKTIQKERPLMAICVYHRKNDIIDIPLYIDSIVENYNYYLRGGFHTILWGIPKDL